MATITSTTTGNFSAGATWVGGIVPGAGDDAVAATGTVVTIDTDVTVLSFRQAGTGKFVLGGGRTVTGNVIANAGTFVSGGTVEVTAGVGTTATINGNVTGNPSTGSIAAIVVTGVGTLVLNGAVTAGNNAGQSAMIYTNVTCTLNINGNVTSTSTGGTRGVWCGSSSNAVVTVIGNVVGIGGTTGGTGSAYGVQLDGFSPSISVTGNVTAGNALANSGIQVNGNSASVTVTGNLIFNSAANGYSINVGGSSPVIVVTGDFVPGVSGGGINANGASANITVTGNVVASSSGVYTAISATGASSIVSVVGNVTAAGALAHGIQCGATANGVIFQGNLTDSLNGATAIYSRLLRVTATNTGTTTYTNTVGYPNGTPVTRVSPDLVTGMPAISNVRSGTVYGYNSELTGTVAIPPTGSVALGAEVDNTTGTAALDVGSVIAVVGQQVSAASSSPSVV